MEHTRGSARMNAINVRSDSSPSISSVFARGRRRGTAIEADFANAYDAYIAFHALRRRGACPTIRSNAAVASPLTERREILLLLGERDVTSHFA